MSTQILVLGSSNVDLILRTSRFHLPGETIQAEDMVMAFGGKGANQAIAAKRLGGKVTLVTKLGRDHYGRAYHRYLVKNGLPEKGILKDDSRPTGIALIELDRTGENRIVVYPGANSSLLKTDLKKIASLWKNIAVLVTQLEIPFQTVTKGLEMAKRQGALTLLNPSPPTPLSVNILSLVDFLVPNESEAQSLAEIKVKKESDLSRVAKKLIARGAKNVIITLGPKGLFFKNREEEIRMKAFRVKAIDTTAAGDAFLGAFACGLAEGKPIRDVLRFASAAGALATTKLGAQPSLPSRHLLEKWGMGSHLKY